MSKTAERNLDYEKHIQVSNYAFTLNTFVRPLGSLASEMLTRKLFYSTFGANNTMNAYLWMEGIKGFSHILGFIYGYYKVAKTQDTTDVTRRWLKACVVSFMGLLALNMELFKDSKYLVMLVAMFYKFWQGDRDAVRPYYYKCVIANINQADAQVSDACKNQMRQRKIMTTVAEMLGGLVMYFVLQSSSNLTLPLVGGLVANVLCLLYHRSASLCSVDDPKMSPALASDFTSKKLPGLLVEAPKNFAYYTFSSESAILSTFKNVFNMKQALLDGTLDKGLTFTYLLIIIRMFTGVSKSYFFYQASWYPQYTPAAEAVSRGLTNWLLMLWDVVQSFYRRTYSRQLISSLGGISLSILSLQLANVASWVTSASSNSFYTMYLGYPLCSYASAVLIPSLTHLFEFWGRDQVDSNPLFDSFKNNLTSIVSLNLSKLFTGLLIRLGVYTPVQIVMCLKAILIARGLVAVANEAESV